MKALIVIVALAVLTGCASPKTLEIGGHCLRCKRSAEEVTMHRVHQENYDLTPLCSRCWHKTSAEDHQAYCQRIIDFYRRNYPATFESP